VLKQILTENYSKASAEDILTFYIVTGGVAKYAEILVNEKAFTHNSIIDYVFSANSLFLEEGKNILIEEFGRDYGTYFSILELIAAGKTARSEIESILEIHSGAYLSKLEGEYALLDRYKPIDAKPGSRLQKYFIRDNFLNFWFRFIYRNLSAVEAGNFTYIREIVERDYATWSGRILEHFFHDLYAASGNFNRIGSYWERGNKNEIDLVAVNDIKKEVVIAEIKANKSRISLAELEKKAKNLLSDYQGYKVDFRALGIEDAILLLKSV
jgi:hypothetical protein